MSNFTLLGCLEVVDLRLETNKQKKQQFHRINGFLTLQFELRMELGLRLRLTQIFGHSAWMKMIEPMGALAPGCAHARPLADDPIDASGNLIQSKTSWGRAVPS